MEERVPSPEINGSLEALLFVAAQTVSSKALARGLDLPDPQVEELLRGLAHAPQLGVRLRKVGRDAGA